VVVLHQWNDFTPGTDFGAWVRQIARNKVYQMSRVARRQILLTEEAIDRIEATVAEEAGVTMFDALRSCLGKLARKARTIVSMRYRGDHDCNRIAEQLGMTAAAVHMALSRARAALASCIRSHLADGSANR
jgi:RNA polymerase sigma-70 factor (ECF subfamily)